jgi:hypothetical protein
MCDFFTLSLDANNEALCFGRCNMTQPTEIHTMTISGANVADDNIKKITHFNDDLMKQFTLSTFEEK